MVRREFAVIAFAIIGMILFNASFGESIISWGGGTATGPRQIVAAMPFAVIALAFLPSRFDWIIAGLVAWSVFAMVMATSVEPHFPYEYANPLRDFALQSYLRGDFAYDRDAYFGGPALVDESTAFNLGKLAGLPGPFQLWPLAMLWIAGVWWLTGLKEAGIDNRWRIGAVGGIVLLFVAPLVHMGYASLQTPPHNGLLGRYYRELRPNGFPPHIVRVDPQLNFGSVGELGGMPGPSRVVWTGTLNVPRTGPYRFAIQSDDSGWLTIDGDPVISANPDIASYTAVGAVYLTAGAHRIEAGEYNIFGDAAMRVSWQPPDGTAEIIPSSAFAPG